MVTIPEVADTLRTVLTSLADTIARDTGFLQRRSKLSGGSFV